ncbi:hypothetical protein ACNOYE_06170 [Nannocystaceae bacterium ST9]
MSLPRRRPLALALAPLLACTSPASDEGGDELGDSSESASESETGSETGETGETGETETDTGEPSPCDALVDGLNTGFDIEGTPRSFYLDLPAGVDEGGPWPVVFSWHGLGDSASNFHGLFAGEVDNPDMPFILVTPEDTDFLLSVPLIGTVPFDWDTFAVPAGGAGNLEVALFDTVLACVDERWGVDAEHVHSVGFSLGGITSDMLATVRGEQLGSVATWSGGYWNNPDNVGLSLNSVVDWPALAVANPYAQLLVHGGPSDELPIVENVYTMSFYEFALSDHDFLLAAGHPVVMCAHTQGHAAPASISASTVIRFFADHPLGVGVSPWIANPPASGVDGCQFDLSP